MNPRLLELNPYPFERLRALFAGVAPPADRHEIRLSIGEPQHPTPEVIRRTLVEHLDGLSVYPTTAGLDGPAVPTELEGARGTEDREGVARGHAYAGDQRYPDHLEKRVRVDDRGDHAGSTAGGTPGGTPACCERRV